MTDIEKLKAQLFDANSAIYAAWMQFPNWQDSHAQAIADARADIKARSCEFQHIIAVKIPCGPPGGEDYYDVEVLLNCSFDGREVHARPFRHRLRCSVKQAPWSPFILGALDGDGYIYCYAEDWIDDHEGELREIADKNIQK